MCSYDSKLGLITRLHYLNALQHRHSISFFLPVCLYMIFLIKNTELYTR